MIRSNEYIVEKLEDLMELSASHTLTSYIELVKDFYLIDGDMEPHQFVLSLILSLYDIVTGSCSNVYSSDVTGKMLKIESANRLAIMRRTTPDYVVRDIKNNYFETIFYSIDPEFGRECMTIYNKQRNKISCH